MADEDPYYDDMVAFELPVDYQMEFPQTLVVAMLDLIFTVTWRFNSYDGSLILRLYRVADEQAVFQGKVPLNAPISIPEPTSGILLFGLWATSIEEDELTVYLFCPGLIA